MPFVPFPFFSFRDFCNSAILRRYHSSASLHLLGALMPFCRLDRREEGQSAITVFGWVDSDKNVKAVRSTSGRNYKTEFPANSSLVTVIQN